MATKNYTSLGVNSNGVLENVTDQPFSVDDSTNKNTGSFDNLVEKTNGNGINIGSVAKVDEISEKTLGAGISIDKQLKSSVATGTAPLQIASTTKVSNLNVDQVDGADLSTDVTMGGVSPSNSLFPSQAAAKTYSDSSKTPQGIIYQVCSSTIRAANGTTVFNTIIDCLNYIQYGTDRTSTRRIGKIYILPNPDGSAWNENILLSGYYNPDGTTASASFDWSGLEIIFDKNAKWTGNTGNTNQALEVDGSALSNTTSVGVIQITTFVSSLSLQGPSFPTVASLGFTPDKVIINGVMYILDSYASGNPGTLTLNSSTPYYGTTALNTNISLNAYLYTGNYFRNIKIQAGLDIITNLKLAIKVIFADIEFNGYVNGGNYSNINGPGATIGTNFIYGFCGKLFGEWDARNYKTVAGSPPGATINGIYAGANSFIKLRNVDSYYCPSTNSAPIATNTTSRIECNLITNCTGNAGGGIYLKGSAIINEIRGCMTTNFGGGVWMDDSSATLTCNGIYNCRSNYSSSAGGGIYMNGGTATINIISGCLVGSNGYGNGACLQGVATLYCEIIEYCGSSGVGSGGGIFVNGGTAKIGLINTCLADYGAGALINNDGGVADINRIYNCSASLQGGGVLILGSRNRITIGSIQGCAANGTNGPVGAACNIRAGSYKYNKISLGIVTSCTAPGSGAYGSIISVGSGSTYNMIDFIDGGGNTSNSNPQCYDANSTGLNQYYFALLAATIRSTAFNGTAPNIYFTIA